MLTPIISIKITCFDIYNTNKITALSGIINQVLLLFEFQIQKYQSAAPDAVSVFEC